MKLTRKTYQVPEVKKDQPEYKQVQVDWKVYEKDWDSIIPHGKHSQRTLEWVKENDEQYYMWMCSNNIISSWGLYKKRGEEPKKVYSRYVNDIGQCYIGIRIVEEPCAPYIDPDE